MQTRACVRARHTHTHTHTHRGFPAPELAKRLWGDFWFNEETRRFQRTAPGSGAPRSFVQFVLEPLYKLMSQGVGEAPHELEQTLAELSMSFKRSQLTTDAKPLLRSIMSAFFDGQSGFVDMCVRHLPSPLLATAGKVEVNYTGDLNSELAKGMRQCKADAPLCLHMVSSCHQPGC